MKMNKITLLLAAITVCCASMTAQTTSRWGITAGVNINNIHFKQHDILPTTTMCGPQLGLTSELNFGSGGFGVDAALLYTLKQGKVDYGSRGAWESLGAGRETVAMHYIDVPLHLKFKYNRLGGTEDTFMPLLYVGPQFSFLPHGSHSNINKYSPVSVYMDLGAGFELFRRLQIKGGYNFSIGQSFHTKLLDDNVAKNRTWYVNVTWFLK